MYTIVKNNRKQKTTYATYEAARQALRKRLRKLTLGRNKGQPNVHMSLFGFTIKQV